MEALIQFIEDSASSEFAVLLLLILSIAESFFFPIPPDILLIPLALLNPKNALLYGFIVVIGSIFGGIIGHQLGNKFGRKILSTLRLAPNKKIETVFDKYGFWAIVVAGITPIPYKIFSISAGIMHYQIKLFILASLVGRGVRFFSIALAIYFLGEQFNALIDTLLNGRLALSMSLAIILFMIALAVNEYFKE
ncbi:MAG: VTT domain-containing protein [Dehalococcoidia bacterium]|nr:VTT domain-containing protein [Dehalococcoidia bacterium]